MTWSYNPAQIQTNQIFQVRYLIGDTNQDDPQQENEEIEFALQIRGSIWGAAAMACESISANLSRKADTVTGELHTKYSTLSTAYNARSMVYEQQAAARSGALPIVGGISIQEKINQESDPDRVPPNFNIGMTDNNNQPLPPAGNESSIPVSDNVPFPT